MIDWSVTFLFYTISVNKSAIIMEIKTQYQLYMYAFLDILTIKNQLLLCYACFLALSISIPMCPNTYNTYRLWKHKN